MGAGASGERERRIHGERGDPGRSGGGEVVEGQLVRVGGHCQAAARELTGDLGLVIVDVLAVGEAARDEHRALAELERHQGAPTPA